MDLSPPAPVEKARRVMDVFVFGQGWPDRPRAPAAGVSSGIRSSAPDGVLFCLNFRSLFGTISKVLHHVLRSRFAQNVLHGDEKCDDAVGEMSGKPTGFIGRL